MMRLSVSGAEAADARNLAFGIYAPQWGFATRAEVRTICESMRLPTGAIMPLPIMLTSDEEPRGERVALHHDGEHVATVRVHEAWRWDKLAAARAAFGTDDGAHPGVAGYYAAGAWAISGRVEWHGGAAWDTPTSLQAEIRRRGWRTTCAFQTRNVPHAGHEDLQKTVLGLCDGLLIQPVIGPKKAGDFRDEVIIAAYEALISEYFASERVLLSPLWYAMRYAGPREAILHAIMRRNCGCTHIIIGRDHAGVGDYYGAEDAIEACEAVADEIGITPVAIRGDFYWCRTCGRVESDRTCSHGAEARIEFCGSTIREALVAGKTPPPEIMRREVAEAIARFGELFEEGA